MVLFLTLFLSFSAILVTSVSEKNGQEKRLCVRRRFLLHALP